MKLLSDKQIGMRMSLNVFVFKLGHIRLNPGVRGMLKNLNDNMTELAQRYYCGDVTVVDEFLQLYCKGTDERKKLAKIEKEANDD